MLAHLKIDSQPERRSNINSVCPIFRYFMNTCCEKGTNLTKALAEPVLPWEVEWTKVPILSNQSNYSVLSTPPVAKYQTQNTKGEGHTEIDKKKCLEQQNQQTAEQIQLSYENN